MRTSPIIRVDPTSCTGCGPAPCLRADPQIAFRHNDRHSFARGTIVTRELGVAAFSERMCPLTMTHSGSLRMPQAHLKESACFEVVSGKKSARMEESTCIVVQLPQPFDFYGRCMRLNFKLFSKLSACLEGKLPFKLGPIALKGSARSIRKKFAPRNTGR
jgi:hypothetical protein